jgi:MFS family permease
VSLIPAGDISDQIGRRPVILAALVLQAASAILFLLAGGVGALSAARVVQGVATGVATGALSAALIDLQPPGSGL